MFNKSEKVIALSMLAFLANGLYGYKLMVTNNDKKKTVNFAIGGKMDFMGLSKEEIKKNIAPGLSASFYNVCLEDKLWYRRETFGYAEIVKPYNFITELISPNSSVYLNIVDGTGYELNFFHIDNNDLVLYTSIKGGERRESITIKNAVKQIKEVFEAVKLLKIDIDKLGQKEDCFNGLIPDLDKINSMVIGIYDKIFNDY